MNGDNSSVDTRWKKEALADGKDVLGSPSAIHFIVDPEDRAWT